MPVKAGLEKLGLESDDVLCVNASRRGVVCKCVEKRSTFAFTTLLGDECVEKSCAQSYTMYRIGWVWQNS